jgi:hypothetical protein
VVGLNDHWAEYYMGALLAHTVVLVLDGAWAWSPWCQGELFRSSAQALGAAARREFPGSEFRLVVVYEQRTYGTEAAARAKVCPARHGGPSYRPLVCRPSWVDQVLLVVRALVRRYGRVIQRYTAVY